MNSLYEGKNINRNMTLRNQLKNVKIQNLETIQSHFTRVSKIKEKVEAIEDNVEEGYIVMTTLNCLPRLWNSFIQGICARRKLISFSRLCEYIIQEEARLITREEKMGATEVQALTFHTRRYDRKKEDHHHNKREYHHHKRQN